MAPFGLGVRPGCQNCRVIVRAAFGPLLSGVTYRRAVHLLLGGVIVLPYVLLGAAFTRLWTMPQPPRAATLLLFGVAAIIAAVPAFLRGTRALEIAAARALLDVDLPDPVPARSGWRDERETRLRAALWFGLHLLFGAGIGIGLIIALPMALIFIAQQFGVATEAIAGLRLGWLDEHDTGWLALTGIVLLVLLVYAIAGLGALAAVMAPVLLGPSPAERIAALEARANRLAERDRLARELHDSIGHALTVTTVQAGAARELLDSDPEFARRALTAIEEIGRGAMDELDHVLGLLREQEPGRLPRQRTLSDLDRLVIDTRATGLTVRLEVTGPIAGLPAAVSREGYRIVQEGLTNAVRHAGRVPVAVRIAVSDRVLGIEVANPVAAGSRAERGAGRGLTGIRERVALLGGQVTAGREGGQWRVAVRLPVERGGRA
jgi:signal transduction histidine kinase